MVIHENNLNHLTDFIRLNEEWIVKYFSLEEVDIELARNPASIVESGGYIFSIVENEDVVGVCALFKESEGVYELARMAVSNKMRGNGYGKTLMNAVFVNKDVRFFMQQFS